MLHHRCLPLYLQVLRVWNVGEEGSDKAAHTQHLAACTDLSSARKGMEAMAPNKGRAGLVQTVYSGSEGLRVGMELAPIRISFCEQLLPH